MHVNMRLLPGAYERIRRAAARAGLTIADYVEAWALGLERDEPESAHANRAP